MLEQVGDLQGIGNTCMTLAQCYSQRHGSENGIYLGKDPNNPQIGDIKVNFQAVNPTQITIAAQQKGDSFVAYQTTAGDALSLVRGRRVELRSRRA